ncbi:hypothetical protein CBM2599_B120193 [Cupriavidus taiwanensis]|nr:hypothetical protein CBM2599_B120193 [Cupriavidus taiwanensis]SOY98393.1 hypothetical protein CBM2600_B130194 [Cupriavidus taiwanensis]
MFSRTLRPHTWNGRRNSLFPLLFDKPLAAGHKPVAISALCHAYGFVPASLRSALNLLS